MGGSLTCQNKSGNRTHWGMGPLSKCCCYMNHCVCVNVIPLVVAPRVFNVALVWVNFLSSSYGANKKALVTHQRLISARETKANCGG